jgi:hypothetical protein
MNSIGGIDLWQLGWGLQLLLIGSTALRPEGSIRLPSPRISSCLLVLALGWVFRLAYLYALASGGFKFWIGDDPLRWLIAWEWAHGVSDVAAPGTWMPGSYYVHGAAMELIADPFYASKLLSATYPVLSLAGVFVFAQAVFRHRGLSCASVVLLAPFWIDILLSTGTMTEMPTVGALLFGAAALVVALRTPVGRRRAGLLLCAAASFAVATTFHLVAWIQLAGILSFLLPVFLRKTHGTFGRRLRTWLAFSAVSSSYCLFWVIGHWVRAGSPLATFQRSASSSLFKLGGPTHVLGFVTKTATPGDLVIVALAVLAVGCLVASSFVRPGESGLISGRLNAVWLSRLRWLIAATAAVLAFLAVGRIERWLDFLPPRQLNRLIMNWFVYPTALIYCLYYYLPLAAWGAITVLFGRDAQRRQHRPVLACIGWVLLLMVATALRGGANITPFRTVLSVSTALVPFALAPLFDLRPAHASARTPRGTASAPLWLNGVLVVFVLAEIVAINHARVFAELPVPSIIPRPEALVRHSDMYALGSWIRAELESPETLKPENLSQPFELLLRADDLGIGRILIQYYVGYPGRFALPGQSESVQQAVERLSPGQVLITDYSASDPRLRLVARIGEYSVFEAAGS